MSEHECPDCGLKCESVQAQLDQYISMTNELADVRDRLISANDTLVARIEDLTEGYGLEDTCPRVQCRTTSRRLKAELDALRAAHPVRAESEPKLLDPDESSRPGRTAS